jgi:hypothetical protein
MPEMMHMRQQDRMKKKNRRREVTQIYWRDWAGKINFAATPWD